MRKVPCDRQQVPRLLAVGTPRDIFKKKRAQSPEMSWTISRRHSGSCPRAPIDFFFPTTSADPECCSFHSCLLQGLAWHRTWQCHRTGASGIRSRAPAYRPSPTTPSGAADPWPKTTGRAHVYTHVYTHPLIPCMLDARLGLAAPPGSATWHRHLAPPSGSAIRSNTSLLMLVFQSLKSFFFQSLKPFSLKHRVKACE